jgi:hypothetical protein
MTKQSLLPDNEIKKIACDVFRKQFSESEIEPDVLKRITVSMGYKYILGKDGYKIGDLNPYCVSVMFYIFVKEKPITMLTVVVSKQTGDSSIHYIMDKNEIPHADELSNLEEELEASKNELRGSN